MNKFYNIDSGKIRIDNKDINNIKLESLRKSISIALQDTFLFSVSVRENIRYVRPNASDNSQVYDTILLDNATSSIDTRTEIHIQEAMDNLMKVKTTFIIAHRLSTIIVIVLRKVSNFYISIL